jgi:Tfp pilus assembly protein PilF
LKLARMYLNDGDFKNARKYLEGSLNVSLTILAHRALADIAMEEKRHKEAVASYEQTLALSTSKQERIENGYLLALACAQAGLPERSSSELLHVLALKPDYQLAAELLAKLHEKR